MIFKTQEEITKYLGIKHRTQIYSLIKKGEVTILYDNKGKRLGYVVVKEFIIQLLQS